MPEYCLSCLEEVEKGAQLNLHRSCVRELFGTVRVPNIEVDPESLHLFGRQMAGKVSISGLQRKVSLGWVKRTLRVSAEGSAYILKPDASLPELPANEHLTLRLGKMAGLDIPANALVRLAGDRLALLIKRFDRGPKGERYLMEDFCQLNGLYAAEKYNGSAELCVHTVREYAGEPLVDMLRLFRQLLFSWWAGNGDLHLKNLSLVTAKGQPPRLSPAYDLVNTNLVIADDPQALTVGDKNSNFEREDWESFGAYCELPPRLLAREIDALAALLPDATELVANSYLSDEMKSGYEKVLHENTALLGMPASV